MISSGWTDIRIISYRHSIQRKLQTLNENSLQWLLIMNHKSVGNGVNNLISYLYYQKRPAKIRQMSLAVSWSPLMYLMLGFIISDFSFIMFSIYSYSMEFNIQFYLLQHFPPKYFNYLFSECQCILWIQDFF